MTKDQGPRIKDQGSNFQFTNGRIYYLVISISFPMKEFMLYIRNAGDAKAALSPDEHLAFVKKCETYIGKLKAGGNLVAAQPILREGYLLSRNGGNWNQKTLDPKGETQVGYYHLRARTVEEAIELAQQNPEFEYVPSASIEIHQVKTKEEETGFVYPK